jgi:hypothetical protein
MSSSSTTIASQQSTYLDSLVSYVLDVKPYHTKLQEIVETYFFNDTFNVSFTEKEAYTLFMGADTLSSTFSGNGVRTRESQSWYQDIISGGQVGSIPLALVSIPKLASQAGLSNFIAGTNDYTYIPGLTGGVYDPKRWAGPGVTNVQLNSVHQQDTVDYFLAYGVCSIDISADVQGNRFWRYRNLEGVYDNLPNPPNWPPEFPQPGEHIFAALPGALTYATIAQTNGSISNITGGNYEEWTLTCTDASAGILSVVGSVSGNIGSATFNIPFTSSQISFTFGAPPKQTGLTIALGDVFFLSPEYQFVLAPDAPIETWSIIKTNPIAITSAPVFTPAIPRTDTPALEIHALSLDHVSAQSSWILTFNGITAGTYTLTKISSDNPYVLVVELVNGCAFKNADIAFTIIPTDNPFNAGDTFTFDIGPLASNFKVFGSVSGWQPNAIIDKWYWNGKIGFKIPSLSYYPQILNSTIATSLTGSFDTWATEVSNNQILTDVSFKNGLFLTSGQNSILGGSLNGQNWVSNISTIFAPTGDEVFIVVGNNGLVATSIDGVTYVKQPTQTTANINGSAFIPALLSSLDLIYDETGYDTDPYDPNVLLPLVIVVGSNGTILTSVLGLPIGLPPTASIVINGVTWPIGNIKVGWSRHVSGVTSNLNAVTYSPEAFIVVGDSGTILRSVDRSTWVKIACPVSANLNDVIYEPTTGGFIIVGDAGVILRSTDGGLTFSNLNQFNGGDLNSLTYGNGTFIAVGAGGYVASSTTGIIWERYFFRPFNSVAYGNGTFVAVGGSSQEQNQFVSLGPVSSVAEPSVYTITFTSQNTATVVNNIYGVRPGLIPNVPWADDFASFMLTASPTMFEYEIGDVVQVYLAPSSSFSPWERYDDLPYDTDPYDGTLNVPLLFNQEYYPFFYANGVVIFPSGVASGSTVTIDKATVETIKFKITNSSAKHPELGAVNDWVPLEFRYFNNFDSSNNPIKANFSDLVTYIEAYAGANPNQRVFTITEPRYGITNYVGSATLNFDPTFFSAYLPFGAKYSLLVIPDQDYSQTIRVKITENLAIYSEIAIKLSDIDHVRITEGGRSSFIEGDYDEMGYDLEGYDEELVITELSSVPSFIITPNFTSTPIATSSFTEGLTIAEYTEAETYAQRLSVFLNLTQIENSGLLISIPASSYAVTVWNGTGTPQSISKVLVEDQSNLGVHVEVTFSWNISQDAAPGEPTKIGQDGLTVDAASYGEAFTFSLPSGINAPFRLWVQ